ncbi:helix-turn-helix domain-containing protein [Yinghuangia sp. ASG 101]|uniref:IclR family transcriptional regulator n=1 Tax=Yinghuangia sp. ASG 101 TaxID=2896848 RepID=UPI001E5BB01F|nr:helix-turn-helix domain-containing protein [Yinghuangia sp. ASG 101]UGQ11954.1 helix-turn-helix domain-containing protein [Yinghuangia sp. ASG 101]
MALQPAPSAQRAVEIVGFLAEHPAETFAVADLARRLGQSRATCQAVLLALESADWVRRGEQGGYTLGAGLIPVGAAAQRGLGVVELLRDTVNELYLALGHEVMACVPIGGQMIVVARAGSSDPFSVAVTVGQSYPLAPPYGLAFAAWDDGEIDRWVARSPHLDDATEARLREAAALVRELGYSVTLDPATRRALGSTVDRLSEARRAEVLRTLAHDEYVTVDPVQRQSMRVTHISAPVFGTHGEVVALMGTFVGMNDHEQVPIAATSLCAATRRLSTVLGAPRAGSGRERSA